MPGFIRIIVLSNEAVSWLFIKKLIPIPITAKVNI